MSLGGKLLWDQVDSLAAEPTPDRRTHAARVFARRAAQTVNMKTMVVNFNLLQLLQFFFNSLPGTLAALRGLIIHY